MVKILFHSPCPDGFTAAWAAWRKFGNEGEYIPVSYGSTVPTITEEDDVYLLDFSYPKAMLETLPRRSLTVLDHHKTARADLEGLKNATIVFDMNRSGAGITWDYFFPADRRPKLVDYAEDHDLWRFNLDSSRAIRAYMHSKPYSFDRWDILAKDLDYFNSFLDCVDKGEAVLDYMQQQVKMICDKAYFDYIDGHAVPVVNATTLYSEVGEELCKRFPNWPYAAYWFRREDGKTQWGARTQRDDVDVSEVAKKYGGGGHRKAAGWVTDSK